MAQSNQPASTDIPPLAPDWLLQPLPARDAANADLDPTDSRFTAMLDLVTRGEYVTAGHRAEQALHEGLMDIRVLGYYVYGYFVEKGPTSLPQVYRILLQTLASNLDALGPRDKRDVHIENTLQWLFTSMLRNVEHHSRAQDETYKQWVDTATRSAIDEALALVDTLQPLIVQSSAKSRASTRFQSFDAWLRTLEPPTAPAAPQLPAKTNAADNKRSSEPPGKDRTSESKTDVQRKRSAREIAEDAKRYSMTWDLGDGNVSVAKPAAVETDSDEDPDEADDPADDLQSDAPEHSALEEDLDHEADFSEDEEEPGESRRRASEPEDESRRPRAARATRRSADEDESELDPGQEDQDNRSLLDRDEEGPLFPTSPRRSAARAGRAGEDSAPTLNRSRTRRESADRRDTRARAESPGQGDTVSFLGFDDEAIEGSAEWQSLLVRLRGFESLLASGEYMKAAVLAHDIQQAIASFDPVRYFPTLFSGFLTGFSAHMQPLETCLKESGSVQFKVLQKLFQVSPEEFLRRR